MRYEIKRATAEHASDLAKLLLDASSGVIEAIYGGLIPGEPTWKSVERRFHRLGTTGSFSNCYVATDGVTVFGGMHAHPMDDLLNDPPSHLIPEDRLWITGPFEKLDPAAAGTFHINFVSVFEPFRGKGIGSALIRRASREAARLMLDEVSLIVFDRNRRAVQLYEQLGFAEVARHPAPRHKAIGRDGDIILMVGRAAATQQKC
ncbi:MAG: GNAT family N-acetyltransferase [Pseudomonadota bacterium]